MSIPLSYTEQKLKGVRQIHPEYYDRILTSEELANFIFMLMNAYSSVVNADAVLTDSDDFVSGDFFKENTGRFIRNNLSSEDIYYYKSSFGTQTEEFYISRDYDISYTRQLRFMPAQWTCSSYFLLLSPADGMCDIYFRNARSVSLKHGEVMILAPYVEFATPCYSDDAYLEEFFIRSSSFDRVFWDQLNEISIMSHFFRNALIYDQKDRISYLIFDTKEDPDIALLISSMKEEILQRLPYCSPLVNAMMSALFSLVLRRYEDTAVFPSKNDIKWKKDFSRVFSFIQNNYASASLKDVAAACNYSTKQISRIVQNYFNMSFTDLVTALRMEKAVFLLKEKTLTIDEISSALGYSDLSSFYRAFRRYYGEPPVRYLKRC